MHRVVFPLAAVVLTAGVEREVRGHNRCAGRGESQRRELVWIGQHYSQPGRTRRRVGISGAVTRPSRTIVRSVFQLGVRITMSPPTEPPTRANIWCVVRGRLL